MTRGAPVFFMLFAAVATACSAPARLISGGLMTAHACNFPTEANQKGIDSAVVTLQVSVNAAGVAVGVRLLEDPGNGFGPVAVRCALEQDYTAARDARGTPYLAMTTPLHIRFVR